MVKITSDATTGPQFFDGQAARWSALYLSKPSFRDRFNLFMDSVKAAFPTPARILDFGCGPGVMSLALARMGYDVVGVDAAQNMIEEAEKERRRLAINNAVFCVMEADSFALAPSSFDAVICSSVLQYIPDDRKVLADIVSLLKPGGLLLISVPHRGSLLGRAEAASARIHDFSRSQGRGFLKYSLRLYGKRDFLSILDSLSLESFRCTFFEVPFLGNFGIRLSRVGLFGMLLLVSARRKGVSSLAKSPPQTTTYRQTISRKNLWNSLQPSTRLLLGQSIGWLPPSLLLGRRFRKTLSQLQQAQWWPAQQTRQYQIEELSRICTLAYERSPYYRRSLEAVGFHPRDLKAPEDLCNLPIIDRHTIIAHLDDLCTTRPDAKGIDYVSTGGTGGSPLHFYIGSDRSAPEYAHLVASWQRVKYDLLLPQAVIRGAIVQPGPSGLRHEYDPLLRRHYYNNFYMGDADMRRYLEHIATIGPCYLHVYPSSVAILARFLDRRDMKPPSNIRGILAGSENVYPDDRVLVERVFGVRYFSWYGHSEKLVMAAECEHSSDYHVWPTYGYFELLDDHGRPVQTPGQRGEIVGTGFLNKVVPFIRYRTGDYATYVGNQCKACGREHPIIRDIRGHRTQEMLVANDDSLISWTALNMHDDTFMHVRQFQFVQHRPGEATLRIVPAHDFTDADRRRIQRNLEQKLTGRIKFEVQLTDEIPLTASGKSTYVEQHVNLQRLVSEKGVPV